MRGNVLVFGAVGLMVGILPALLVAGAYATWVSGGPVDQVKLTTVFDFFGSEPFNTGAAIGAGVLAVFGLG
ncbi:MAG: hypothetical protein KDE45_25460, partial [Caldilineaceae bacterium]|nr:hypothetical protein [Caldilineaceae bacterium]